METDMTAFLTLHRGIPREGPGSDECTRKALQKLPPLPESPRVLDLGCGPGRQTLVLARELGVPIVAVDIFEQFLDQLRDSAKAEELGELIKIRQADMGSLDDDPGSIDLIWSEAAIYLLGFEEGLRRWRPLLRDRGFLVASEVSWLTDDRPVEAVSFWEKEYPAMTDVSGNIATARRAGFDVLDHFAVPRSAWWDEYYEPLSKRAESLRAQAAGDPDLARVLDENDREMDFVDRYGEYFGYVFYLMQRAD